MLRTIFSKIIMTVRASSVEVAGRKGIASMRRTISVLTVAPLMAAIMALSALPGALADSVTQTLPFSQDWANTGLITVDDDWSGVAGIVGYRGDSLTPFAGDNPQNIVGDGTGVPGANPIDVIPNQTNPDSLASGGVAEFQITNPVVALQGSGTAAAPNVVMNIGTTGKANINVAYNLRDIDGSIDNAVQPVALQYRVGSTGDYTNVPAGFVSDATTGPSLANQVTPVNATLPSDANNQPLVQVRVITANASGADEWVGIDDISITGTINDLPTISDIADKTISQNTDTGEIPFTVGDTETPAKDLTVTASSNNTTLVPNSNIVIGPASPTDGNRTVKVTPVANGVGTADITVTVTDADGGSSSDTFKLTVLDTTAPIVTGKVPTDAATGVKRSTNVTATFSEKMKQSTLVTDPTNQTSTTFTLTQQGSTTPVDAKVSYDEATNTVTLDPVNRLARRKVYIAKISGAKDEAGNTLADTVWSFKTGRR